MKHLNGFSSDYCTFIISSLARISSTVQLTNSNCGAEVLCEWWIVTMNFLEQEIVSEFPFFSFVLQSRLGFLKLQQYSLLLLFLPFPCRFSMSRCTWTTTSRYFAFFLCWSHYLDTMADQVSKRWTVQVLKECRKDVHNFSLPHLNVSYSLHSLSLHTVWFELLKASSADDTLKDNKCTTITTDRDIVNTVNDKTERS